jgi:hypothetical protein
VRRLRHVALLLGVLSTCAAGCEEIAKSTGIKKEVVFIGSGTQIEVEGLNGPTKMEWVFSHEKKISGFGDWPLPLAPAILIEHDAETATIDLLDPAKTPGCGVVYGGLSGARLRVKVPYSDILYLRDEGPDLTSIPFECIADITNDTGRNASWVSPRDPELRKRSEKAVKKLRRAYPKADALPPQKHMIAAGQVPRIAKGSALYWRSGAKAGEVGDRGIHFGAFGTTKDPGRNCLRDRLGIWPRRIKKKRVEDLLQENLIELCVDEANYREPGLKSEPDRGAPSLEPRKKKRRF